MQRNSNKCLNINSNHILQYIMKYSYGFKQKTQTKQKPALLQPKSF